VLYRSEQLKALFIYKMRCMCLCVCLCMCVCAKCLYCLKSVKLVTMYMYSICILVTVEPEVVIGQTVAMVTVPASAANSVVGFVNNLASVDEGMVLALRRL